MTKMVTTLRNTGGGPSQCGVSWNFFLPHSSPQSSDLDFNLSITVFIGPESDHCNWLCLSVTHWLTDWRFVNLIDVTLACEDANSKLVDVVTVADVDDEDHVGNSLLQLWKLRFGHKAKLLIRLWAKGLIKILKLKFRRDFEAEVWSVFCKIVLLNLG